MQTKQTPTKMDVTAPDGTEIRLLLETERGSTCHCTLPVGKTSLAGTHRTIQEIWYCLQGQGEMWRKEGAIETIVDMTPGTSLTIPTHTHFQFRNTDTEPLCVHITTMPPWPGPDEWVPVPGKW